MFKDLLTKTHPTLTIDEETVDAFVKNAHHIKLLRGRRHGAFEEDKAALGASLSL